MSGKAWAKSGRPPTEEVWKSTEHSCGIKANLKESRTVRQKQRQEMNSEETFGKGRNIVDPGKAWRTEVLNMRTPGVRRQ